jgi:hypothetical protein
MGCYIDVSLVSLWKRSQPLRDGDNFKINLTGIYQLFRCLILLELLSQLGLQEHFSALMPTCEKGHFIIF